MFKREKFKQNMNIINYYFKLLELKSSVKYMTTKLT